MFMVLVGLIALSLASPTLGPQVLQIASELKEAPPTQSPCPEGAGCRSATPTPTPTLIEATATAGPSVERRWYGYELIISDVFSVFLAVGGAVSAFAQARGCLDVPVPCGSYAGPVLLFGIGIGGFVLGPPLIHLVHHQYGNAGLSFLLRATPVALLFLTSAYPQAGPVLGPIGVLGILAAVIVDDTLLSDEPLRSIESRPESGPNPAAPGHGALGLAYGGRF
jgi:hypothetical protein